jgi:formylglycine-generating enzyme required for sulfatase activity
MNVAPRTAEPSGTESKHNEHIRPIQFAPSTPARAPLPWRRWARNGIVTALLLAAAYVISFISSARSVAIRVQPAEADWEIHGGFSVAVGDRRLMRPGAYSITAEAPGYRPLQQTFSVGKASGQTFEFTMRILPGILEIETSPVSGAQIRLDGETMGETPATLVAVDSGRHVLDLEAKRYLPASQAIEVEGKGLTQRIHIELEPAWAPLGVTSRPAGARVYADRELLGETPLRAEIEAGSYVLTVAADGYAPWQKFVTVVPGQAVELADIVLERESAARSRAAAAPAASSARQQRQDSTREHPQTASAAGSAPAAEAPAPAAAVPQEPGSEPESADRVAAQPVQSVPPAASGSAATRLGHTMLPFLGGRFEMGSSRREHARRANEILHTVELRRPFYLSAHEVTNRQFSAFDPAHVSGDAEGEALDQPDQPVANVTWTEAARYCNWLSAQESLPPFYRIEGDTVVGFNPQSNGYRLPTEAEWEWAARVPKSGQEPLTYPWGMDLVLDGRNGNYADASAAQILAHTITGYDDGYAVAAPVGSFPANRHGLFDMGGNVAEWVHDVYELSPADTGEIPVDPLGKQNGRYHVIRGSSWAHGTPTELRLAFRDFSEGRREDIGFRVARYQEQP